MDLPLELIHNIAKYLSKDDLTQLRLVCKYFAEVFVPLLFNSILLVANARKLEDARLTVSHFPTTIKTVYISPINYPSMTEAKYVNAVLRACRTKQVGFSQCHLDLGYKAYCKLRKEQQEIMASREISMLLCQILNKAPNILRVVIRMAPTLSHITLGELHNYCTMNNCGLAVRSHELLRIPASTTSDCGMSFVPSLLLALSTTTATIRGIVVHPEPYHLRIPAVALRMSTRQVHNINMATSNLTKLVLSLEFISPADERVAMDGTFADLLSSTTKLECLFLRITTERNYNTFGTSKHVSFEALFQGCRLPRLKSFYLAGTQSRAESLLSFLSRSPSLEALVLRNHKLTSGAWVSLIELLRDQLDLRDVQLSGLSGGFEEDSYPEKTFYDDLRLVDKYFFRGGENPFLEGARDRYVRSLRGDQTPNWTGGQDNRTWYGVAFDDAYHGC